MQALLTMAEHTGKDFGKKERVAHSNNFIGGLVAVLLIMAIVASFSWIMKPGTLPVKQVHIEGEFLRLDTNQLKILVTDKVTGGFFNIDVAAIRGALMTLPWVKDVSVHRAWPDGVRVVVDEQIAVVRWNETGLLNDQGQYFSPEKSSFPKGLPFLEGPDESRKLLLERFRLLRDNYGLSLVRLHLNDRRAWVFELDSGLSVVLGRKDFDSRIKRFVNVVTQNLDKKLFQVDEIDMRYTNGFAVRWQ